MITYSTDENTIFVVQGKDAIMPGDIKNFLKKFKTFDDLPDDLLLLYDFSDAELHVKTEDVEVISQLADEATEPYHSVRTAFVVDKPLETAFTMLFAQATQKENKFRKVFTTKAAAVKWLLPKS